MISQEEKPHSWATISVPIPTSLHSGNGAQPSTATLSSFLLTPSHTPSQASNSSSSQRHAMATQDSASENAAQARHPTQRSQLARSYASPSALHSVPVPPSPQSLADAVVTSASSVPSGSAPSHEGEKTSRLVKRPSPATQPTDSLDLAHMLSYFVAGGAAGATSRTVVSPLERLKIIMQVQPRSASGGAGAYGGVVSGLAKMWREEGMAGMLRGNGINCLRIAPYSAVQFSSYESCKAWLRDEQGELSVASRLSAGALAGIASVVSTYPLDLVRSRLSIASASMHTEAAEAVATKTATAGAPQSAAATKAPAQSRPAVTGSSSASATRVLHSNASRTIASIPGFSGSMQGGPVMAMQSFSSSGTSTSTSGSVSMPSSSSSAAAVRGGIRSASSLSASQLLRQELEARQRLVPGIWEMTLKVYREEGGIRGLYRGCVPTSVGVAPYVSLNFFAYEWLRSRMAVWAPAGPEGENAALSTLGKLGCGALAGSFSQTLTYPLDVLRRRMQVAGMRDGNLGLHDRNSFDAIRTILRTDGFRGLYRGLLPNLLKVAPSIGTSFCTYELVRDLLERSFEKHHIHTLDELLHPSHRETDEDS